MKKLVFLAFAFFFFSLSFAQLDTTLKANSSNDQIQEYLKKAKEKKVSGLIMLGVGGLIGFSTKSLFAGETSFGDEMTFGFIKLLAAAALVTGGILQLSSSAKFKSRSKVIMLKQKTSGPLKLKDQWQLGIAIKL